MLTVMTLALAQAAHVSSFDSGFYTVAATVIPVLFLALAVEHGLISILLNASSSAANKIGELMTAYILYVVFKSLGQLFGRKQAPAPPAKPRGPLRRQWDRIFGVVKGRGLQASFYAAIAVPLVPALLAVGVLVFGIGGEIFAVVALYDNHAASWVGTFDLTSVIFLTVLIGLPPALVLAQAAGKAYREFRPAEGAANTAQGTADTATTGGT